MKKWILILCLVFGLTGLAGCAEQDYGPVSAEAEATLTEQAENLFDTCFLATAESGTIEEMYQQYVDDENDNMANAMQAWEQLQDELGEYQGIASCTVETAEDGYTVEMVVNYEKRDLNVSLISDKKLTAWTSIALEADYSLGEKIEQALLNTVMGMGTVFVVLIIIIFVISLFGIIGKTQNKKAEKKEEPAPKPAPAVVPAPAAPAVAAAPQDDLALIAVITAAIAAAENTPPDGLIVRSIRRAGRSNWKHS